MNDNSSPRVAIIGASGIGKNHAAWFAKNGCAICAFAGTNAQSLESTSAVLSEHLGYTPSGYTDVEALLKKEEPDIVCIASPPRLHFEHTQLCITHGVATLCEKPLVYDPSLSSDVLRRQAWQLVEEAAANDVLLGTQMQYGMIGDKVCEFAGVAASAIETFSTEMETKNLKPGRSHETIWIELAPHPLSILQKVLPQAQLVDDSIECRIGNQETDAKFVIRRQDGSTIAARLVVRCNPDTSNPLRRFTINGNAVDIAGRKNESGDFLTYLSTAQEEIEMLDLVDLLIANFLAAYKEQEPLRVTAEDGARNVEWLLQILEAGERV